MSGTVDISGLDPADVLAALYNAARPQGLGFLQYDPALMTRDEAVDLLKERSYFDYLKGRVMKIEITDPLAPHLYDRDNGSGAAKRVIAALRVGTERDVTTVLHESGKQSAAREMKESLGNRTKVQTEGDFAVVRLGVDDVAKPLNEAIDHALSAGALIDEKQP